MIIPLYPNGVPFMTSKEKAREQKEEKIHKSTSIESSSNKEEEVIKLPLSDRRKYFDFKYQKLDSTPDNNFLFNIYPERRVYLIYEMEEFENGLPILYEETEIVISTNLKGAFLYIEKLIEKKSREHWDDWYSSENRFILILPEEGTNMFHIFYLQNGEIKIIKNYEGS